MVSGQEDDLEMPDELESTDGNASVDLGIFPEGTSEESVETEPVAEAPSAEAADTQPGGGDSESQTQQDTEPTSATQQAEAEGDGTSPAKFRFLDKDYDDLEAAEQSYKSWDGRIQAETQRRQDAEKRNEEYWRYVDEASKQNQELLKQVEELKGKGTEEKDPQESKDLVESLDWDSIENVMKIAANQGHDPQMVGMRMVAQQMGEHFQGRLDTVKSELSAPIEAAKESDQFETAALELFKWAKTQENDQGEALYPELVGEGDHVGDPDFTRSMYSAWQTLAKTSTEFGFTAEALDYAYRLASDAAAKPRAETPTEPAATETESAPGSAEIARNAKGQFTKPNGVAAEAASMGTSGMDPTSQPVIDEGRELLNRMAKIKQVKAVKDGPDLGFFE